MMVGKTKKEEFSYFSDILNDTLVTDSVREQTLYAGLGVSSLPKYSVSQRQTDTEADDLADPDHSLVDKEDQLLQQENVEDILTEMGVKKETMYPLQAEELARFLTARQPRQHGLAQMDLSLFDGDVYEGMNAVDLKWTLKDGVPPTCTGRALVPGPPTLLYHELYKWTTVVVKGNNKKKALWTVETAEGLKRMYKVARIRLVFDAEDPRRFARRVKSAMDLKADMENSIRYNLFLDGCLEDGLATMPVHLLVKIFSLITRLGLPRGISKQSLKKLKQEIQLSFKKAEMDMMMRRRVANKCGSLADVAIPRKQLFPKTPVSIPGYDFAGIRSLSRWSSLWSLSAALSAHVLAARSCMHLEDHDFFTRELVLNADLPAFEETQQNNMTITFTYLKGKWWDSVVFAIQAHLQDIDKGWYNLGVSSWDIYEVSKLYRLLELVRFRMQHYLRRLVERSMATLVDLCETPCLCTLTCNEDYQWNPEDLINSPFDVPTPLFHLDLMFTADGPCYSTQPEQFSIVIQELLREVLYKCHFVKQIQPTLLSNLTFEENMYLTSVGLMEPNAVEASNRLIVAYEKAIIPLKAYCRQYEKYRDIYEFNIEAYIETFKSEKRSAAEVKEILQGHVQERNDALLTLPQIIRIGPFTINVNTFKYEIIEKRSAIIAALLKTFVAAEVILLQDIINQYKGLARRLAEHPVSIEHIADIREWMETVPYSIMVQQEATRAVTTDFEIVLDHFSHPLEKEEFKLYWEAVAWPHRLSVMITDTLEYLLAEEDKFSKFQQENEQALMEKITDFTAQCVKLQMEDDINKVHEVAVNIRHTWKMIKEAQTYGQLLNRRQKLLKIPVTPYEELDVLVKQFEPFRNLWVTASDFLDHRTKWLENPVLQVEADSMEGALNSFLKTIIKCTKTFSDVPKVQAVAVKIKEEIEQFKPLLPLFLAVRCPGMKQRHWEDFTNKTGLNVTVNDKQTFQMYLSQGLAEHAETVQKISEGAAREYTIEQALDNMQLEWANRKVEVTGYKDTGSHIIKISDEALQLMEEQVLSAQQQSFSPFRAAHEERIREWQGKLALMQEVAQLWMECQKQWMYLEPIFGSEDIRRELPAESKKFTSMEFAWKRIMASALENPMMIELFPSPSLLESLRGALHLLQEALQGLQQHMELKRSRFPRFYFLADEELLEILARAREPTAVQPHLSKCFENIAKLTFEKDLRIVSLHSAEGEEVALRNKFYPRGSVESWMALLEDTMQNTVRLVQLDALADLCRRPRRAWVLQWPGQAVLTCSQLAWTAEVEEAIRTQTMRRCYSALLTNLDDLRSLVKEKLTVLSREILSALIVIEVHARDITRTLLDTNIRSVQDFEWICQLRYYVEDRAVGEALGGDDGTDEEGEGEGDLAIVVDTAEYYSQMDQHQISVKALNTSFPYGNEYLGNSGRLVITPLTDRCYLTLMGAMHLKFGGAPAGPAGTGKTETTKDLAKALAYKCVVFNCSDQLDYMAMGKFFKGLASCGAWACFDEFNRIDVEVLSVVAQQVVSIQRAQQQRLRVFSFQGRRISLRDSCAVFITMNPGYAGRTELPDNLKALFRPVAMMVPNFALIVEISLFSFGFSDAKVLAIKITTTFKLCMEQLSVQDHYDYGMRAVKTVITVAGNLMRQLGETMDEEQIVLRAICDVNLPKFVKEDLLLFNGIISDLFPRAERPSVDYGILEAAIRTWMVKMNCHVVNELVHKTIQLYETTVVRHGLMLVGPAGAGKTKCYQILQAAMTALQGKPTPSGLPFTAVHAYPINPKSITMGQLYGEFDAQTHEWTDGILSCLVREGIAAEDEDKRWYVFDGPVDAVWIENMNTVLDDNKKLCLSSGEMMRLSERQRMLFEVEDLVVASPATVSRCGMVYLGSQTVGIRPLVAHWLGRLPPLAENLRSLFTKLLDAYLFPMLVYLRGGDLRGGDLREMLTSCDSSLVLKFLELLDWRLRPISGRPGQSAPPAAFLVHLNKLVPCWVVWCLVWSVGATCDSDSRAKFSSRLRGLMADMQEKIPFPEEGTVYDYRLHDGGFTDHTEDGEPALPTWRNWMEGIEKVNIKLEGNFTDIEVPTIDSVRSAYLLRCKLGDCQSALCVGPPGTGKTSTARSTLQRGAPQNTGCDFIVFSAKTGANDIQDVLESRLEKRRKGVLAPPPGRKQIFFIDNLNMPTVEKYGAQPPIELLRQWMDFRGFYDRQNIGEFRQLADVGFVAAMAPPGGGRNSVTMRLLRHFHYIGFTEMTLQSKREIFGSILNAWLVKTSGCSAWFEAVLSSSLHVFETVVSDLLPTPTKCHYTFNLRDLSKVFQGMLMLPPSTVTNPVQVAQLWYHETCRVYRDRLVDDKDQTWFDTLISSQIREVFRMEPADVVGDGDLLYCDFIDVQKDDKVYTPVRDMAELQNVLEQFMEEYNSVTPVKMNLVLFKDALSHVCRVSRILRQPLGNALLLGMGGSGRQSLSRLACFVAEMIPFQIVVSKGYQLTDWRDDLKKVMLKAGVDNKQVMFLFTDTQIKLESFLEDLNSVLSAGDVPSLYQAEELDRIYMSMREEVVRAGLPLTKANLLSCFHRLVRCNLHLVICMAPIGEMFRSRLRQFPSLISCCTVDWFSAWPASALQGVARHCLLHVPGLQLQEEQMQAVAGICQLGQQSVALASERMWRSLGRRHYTTPASFLQMLSSFSQLYATKSQEISAQHRALTIGLSKLYETEKSVAILQGELAKLKPQMEVAARETAKVIQQIEQETRTAEEARVKVEKETEVAEKKKNETEVLAADAQKDLDEALPALLAAEKSLKALNRNDVTEVKAMKNPPRGVVQVMESLCIVFNIKPIKVAGGKIGEKVLDYWKPGSALLADPGAFLDSLMNFNKDSITEGMIGSLKKYVTDPNYQPDKIKTVSKACTSLCLWVHAMYKFYHVNLSVIPKKEALKQANEELAISQEILSAAQEKLQVMIDGLNKLKQHLLQKEAEKQLLEDEVQECLARMRRAARLINGLGNEKVRWIRTIAELELSLGNVTGDILLCSCAVAYLTPFTDVFRRDLLRQWADMMVQHNVPHTLNCSPHSVLGVPVLIRSWQVHGLPQDQMSTESAVLVMNSSRWPLFIDPQMQANHWIKNMCKNDGLEVCKPNDKNLLQSLDKAVRFGKPLLLENVGEDLDTALDPIIKKQFYEQAGRLVVNIGDAVVPYQETFRLYLTTKLANPSYTPEVCVKLQIVDFTLVPSGMQEQLLSLCVSHEQEQLEAQRVALVAGGAQMAQQLMDMQARVLAGLCESQGNPVDDEELISTLEAIKLKSEEITIKVSESLETQARLELARGVYVPVARRGVALYFSLASLAAVDPMYQHSLAWFLRITSKSMLSTQPNDDIDVRVQTIMDQLTFSLYSEACRGLFQRHRMPFAFSLCLSIQMQEGAVRPSHYHFLLNGAVNKMTVEKPDEAWITPKMWDDVLSLSALEGFEDFVANFHSFIQQYQRIHDSEEPYKMPLPGDFGASLDTFQRLLVLRVLRPDALPPALQQYVCGALGERFAEPPAAGLSSLHADSTTTAPLIFVLSAGTDPAQELMKFADKMKMSKRLQIISLGQGQGARAEAMLHTATQDGAWLFFQNCHLSPSWMPCLEQLVEQLSPETVHPDFRLWLTSMPSPHFPPSLLQNGTKMTVEPPRGIRSTMMKAYASLVTEFADYFDSKDSKVEIFKTLVYRLCLFHGIVLERGKFGRLGFNVPYEFTDGDLRICLQQLQMFVRGYEELPLKMLLYVAGDINYGGRVTDSWDRRCLLSLLRLHCRPGRLPAGLSAGARLQQHAESVRLLPHTDRPGMIGLHDNAAITLANQESQAFIGTLRVMQGQQISSEDGAHAAEGVIEQVAEDILGKLPALLPVEVIRERFPVRYEESLNTVLLQEAKRYNKLLVVISSSLRDLLKAMKGLVIMTPALEEVSAALSLNQVPAMWSTKAYPSLKPLGSWMLDLVSRLESLWLWSCEGAPQVFWISGLFSPQALLTAILQNYARKYVLSIDTIKYDFEIPSSVSLPVPDDVCCIRGMFLEGARWSRDTASLHEARPNQLMTEMPMIFLRPVLVTADGAEVRYECPAYRTRGRSHFVLAVMLPTGKEQAEHWVQRGTALINELDY